MKIYVGNLALGMSEADLRRMFGCFGHVTSAVVARDELSGQPKEFGYVEMPAEAEAWNAIRWLDGQGLKIQGWTLSGVELER